MKKIIYTFMFCCALMASSAFAQGGSEQVAEGNKLFAEEKYDQANNNYRDALLENPESPIVHFNVGDVLYKKKNYEEAIKSYQKTTSAEDIQLQSKSYYNMGNALYKSGKLPESILMYKKALELNPNDEDAKYNLEYVRAKLKDQAQKQSQQNQQQQGEQQPQAQQNQNQNSQERKEQQQQEMQTAEREENQQEQPEKQQQQQQMTQAEEISKEDAERILEALKNEEEELLQQQRAKKQGRAFRGKDW